MFVRLVLACFLLLLSGVLLRGAHAGALLVRCVLLRGAHVGALLAQRTDWYVVMYARATPRSAHAHAATLRAKP